MGDPNLTYLLVGFVAGAALIVCVLVCLLLWAISPRCPHCGSKRGHNYAGSKYLGSEKAYAIVLRRHQASGYGNAQYPAQVRGHATGYSEERVPVVCKNYSLEYRCGRCGRGWNENLRTEEEDFSRS